MDTAQTGLLRVFKQRAHTVLVLEYVKIYFIKLYYNPQISLILLLKSFHRI